MLFDLHRLLSSFVFLDSFCTPPIEISKIVGLRGECDRICSNQPAIGIIDAMCVLHWIRHQGASALHERLKACHGNL